MARTTPILALAAAGAILAIAGVSRAQEFGQPKAFLNQTPKEVDGLTIENRQGEPVPMDLVFTDSTGRPVSLASCAPPGRPVIIQMLYFRCPLLCPKSTEQLMRSLSDVDLALGEDYGVLMVSFDPRDSTDDARFQRRTTVAQYDRAGASTEASERGVRVLTGDAETIKKLADAIGFQYRYLPKSDEFSHGAAVFVVTPDGRLSRAMTGLQYPSRDLKLALLQAGDGSIGDTWDLIWQTCFHLDPATGEYTLAAYQLMRLSGIASALLLGSFVGVLVLRDRARRRRHADAHASNAASVAFTGNAR